MAIFKEFWNRVTGLKSVEARDRPDFGRSGYIYDNSYSYPSSYWSVPRTAIDYRRELGDLHNSSLIMAIVNWTGIQLAEALPVVTKPDNEGVPQVQLQHPASDLIRRPNPFHIWADYTQALAFDWWMGNCYFKKVYSVTGELVELWYLPAYMIEPRWPDDGGSPEVPRNEADNTFLSHYEYRIPGKPPELIPRSRIVHIKRGVNISNPRKGAGVWDAVLEEVYGDGAVARFSATIMKNMGMTRVLLSPKEGINGPTPSEAAAMKQQWMIASTGDNANTPMIVPNAMSVDTLDASPKELDLKELRNVPESRVAGVTGIPAIVLQFLVGLEHGHYGAAYEQARQQGYESVIIPIQKHISEDLTWQVLPELEKAAGARLDFDISKVRVLQEDRDALYKRESEALRAGGITINQFLQSIGKTDLGDAGDIRYVPSTSTPMNEAILIEKASTAPQPPPTIPNPNDATSLAKFMDMERLFSSLEEQMKGFVNEQR